MAESIETTSTSDNNSKISMKELIWLGFSYTASGLTFTSAFAVMISGQNGVGWWIFLVIILGALFIGATSWAYKKCADYYGTDANGGAYIYVRSSYGRFWGWFIGFVQYVTLPTSIIVSIIALIDQNIGHIIPSSVPFIGDGAKYQHLILNIIGIIVFVLSATAIYFGLKSLRIAINVASITQWLSCIIVIGAAIYLFALNGSSHLTPSHNGNGKFNFWNFNNAEITFIYFFVGFETYSSIGKNLKNSKKSSLGKAIMLVLFLVTVFYLVVTFVFIGALGIDSFKNNSTQVAIGNNPALEISSKAMGITGTVIIVISIFTTKLNSLIQSSLYGGTMLEPLAVEGYIDERLMKMQKNNIPFRASLANTIITLILAISMLIIPNFFVSDIDFSTAVGFSSLFSVLIYVGVVLSALKIYFNKLIKFSKFELVLMFISALSLSWLSISYFITLFMNITRNSSAASGTMQFADFVINLIQLILLIALLGFSVVWYYMYYNPKYKKRMAENPSLQQELDQKFSLIRN